MDISVKNKSNSEFKNENVSVDFLFAKSNTGTPTLQMALMLYEVLLHVCFTDNRTDEAYLCKATPTHVTRERLFSRVNLQ